MKSLDFRKTAVYGLLGVAAFSIVLGVLAARYYWQGPARLDEQTVVIPPQSGTALIGRKLQDAGVVRNAKVFRIYAAISGTARHLKAGEYAFPSRATLAQVARQMAAGQVVQHALTIPEGYTAVQIAQKLEEAGLVKADAFMAVVHDAVLIRSWQLPGETMEGFLFPETYQFTKGMTSQQIARRMVDQFQNQVTPELINGAKKQGLNLLQLTTLASIIEREVRAKPEQAIVASIFYNRLQNKKRLESCATVLYSQGRISGTLSLDDLENKSPYNTYRHRGLPPGPIGNPGLNALRAAAFPAQTEYLFFVVRPDGTHVFSKTFEDHKRAKWQQKRARRQDASSDQP